ncbi:MAG TPA: hypothetical protein VJT67_11090, partial [Longimicrobiaceae bacterium]|nr:hypothetical protein [Longimicrobiaceae bacterium]
NGLDQFKHVVNDFRSVAGLATKAAVAVPLASLFSDIGPPWPSSVAVGVITPLLELLVLLVAFEFWNASPQKQQRRRIIVFTAVLAVAFGGYLWITSSYTTPHPAGGMVVHGYRLDPEVRSLLGADYTVNDALEGAGYDPTRVWTPGSVTMVRFTLLASWLTAFASVAGIIAVFVMHQGSRQAPRRRSRPRRPKPVPAGAPS